MAEAVISSVVRYLGNLLYQEAIFLHGVHDQVEWIQRELRRMQCFLKDADAKAQRDERVKNWVNDVRDVAYEAEDIIDTFLLEVKHRHQRGFIGRVKRYAFMPLELKARYDIRVQIEKMRLRIDEISTSRAAYGISDLGEGGTATGLPFQRPLPPHSDDADVIGLVDDKRIMLERLLDGQNLRRCVLSIIGIGGLGKTTLARKIFSSNEMVQQFPVRVWLTVSYDFNLIQLLRNILVSVEKIKKEELQTMGEEDLIEAIKDSLEEKRYLIVMDDVWTNNFWNRIQSALPDMRNGSRVLITSRSVNVARLADPTVTPYELHWLNEEESLELLLKKAFPYQEIKSNCPKELFDVGRQLAERCGGLPLALVVLGGLLSIKDKTHSAWLKVAETLSWHTDGVGCMEILALSYQDLPYHLKPCFLYLAAFPEDFEISTRRLFRLWIAEGFIPREERKTMEETAETFVEELKQRCMVQVSPKKWRGEATMCRIHDLLHDLARSEARENGFLVAYKNIDESIISSRMARRATLHCDVDLAERRSLTNFRTLTLLESSYQSLRSAPSMKLLRVIDVQGRISYSDGRFQVKRLPKAIVNLFHLRYLRLRGIGLTELPSSIDNLQNLETIDVRDNLLSKIPKTIWNIKTLRHVHISARQTTNTVPYSTLPPTADMRNLQTLEWARLESNELQWRLPNLRKLGLTGIKRDHGAVLAKLFEELHHLKSLWLVSTISIPKEILDTRVFPFHIRLQSMWLTGRWAMAEACAFPPHLTKLSLRSSGLKQDPMPELERLQHLSFLALYVDAYEGKEMVCSASGFPRLKCLKVSYLKDLEEWRVESGAMPMLGNLVIEKCHGLRTLPDLQHVTSLETLDLIDMSSEQETKWLAGDDWCKIQHVPSIRKVQEKYIPKLRSSEGWENRPAWRPKMVEIQR